MTNNVGGVLTFLVRTPTSVTVDLNDCSASTSATAGSGKNRLAPTVERNVPHQSRVRIMSDCSDEATVEISDQSTE